MGWHDPNFEFKESGPIFARWKEPFKDAALKVIAKNDDSDKTSAQLVEAAKSSIQSYMDNETKLKGEPGLTKELKAVFVYWKGDIAFVQIIRAGTTRVGDTIIPDALAEPPVPLVNGVVMAWGMTNAVTTFKASPQEKVSIKGPADHLRILLHAQAIDSPKSVGPPFTEFKISRQSGDWDGDPDVCAAFTVPK